MRKAIFAALLTLALATPAAQAAASRDRDIPRDRETPIVRIIRTIKRLITTGEISIPIP